MYTKDLEEHLATLNQDGLQWVISELNEARKCQANSDYARERGLKEDEEQYFQRYCDSISRLAHIILTEGTWAGDRG